MFNSLKKLLESIINSADDLTYAQLEQLSIG